MDIMIEKIGESVNVNFDGLANNVQEFIIRYGLTQILNDAHSSVTKKAEPDAEKRKAAVIDLVSRKLAALESGDIRTRTSGTKDPVLAEAVRIALRNMKPIVGPDGKRDDKAMRAMARKLVDANPAYRHLAQKHIEEMKELGLPEIEPDGDEPDGGENE